MSHILSRQFTAVDCRKNCFFIRDIAQLICDYGISRFLETFGYSHGKLQREREVIGYKEETLFNSPYLSPIYRLVVVSEKKYTLTDAQGRIYCPRYLLSVFEEAFPKKAAALNRQSQYKYNFDNSTSASRRRSRSYFSAGLKKRSGYKRLRIQDAQLAESEANVKGVRKLKGYWESPYDDPFFRSSERSWKRHRGKQYKV